MLSAKKLVVFLVYRQSFGAAKKKEKENKIKLVYAECILMFSSMLFCPTVEGPGPRIHDAARSEVVIFLRSRLKY